MACGCARISTLQYGSSCPCGHISANYCSLATRHAAQEAAAATDPDLHPSQGSGVRRQAAGHDPGSGTAGSGHAEADLEAGGSRPPSSVGDELDGSGASRAQRMRRRSSEQYGRRYLGESLGSSISSALQRIGFGLLEASTAAWEFLLRCCTVAERPPYFVLVTVAAPPAAAGQAAQQQQERRQGQQLQEQLQHILDSYRRTDIAAARERQEQQVRWQPAGCMCIATLPRA